MLRISTVKNDAFMGFGVRVHISKNLMYFDISIGRRAIIIWLKDRTSVISKYPMFIDSLDSEDGL